MNLNFKLSEEMINLIKIKDGEKIHFCAPFDIDFNGNLLKIGYFYAIVTSERLIVINDGAVQFDKPIRECGDIKCEPMTDCGIFTVFPDGIPTALFRYSMKHMIRFSYIARGAMQISKGQEPGIASDENEKICPKCGRALPGTKECYRCDGSRTAIKNFLSLISPFKIKIIFVSAIMVLSSGLIIGQNFIQRYFIDDVLVPKKGDMKDIAIFLGSIAAIEIFTIGITVLRYYMCVKLGVDIATSLRHKVYNKIQLLSLSFVNKRKPGDLINRMIHDTSEIRKFLEDGFCSMFSMIITMIVIIIVMFVMNWRLTLLSIIFIPIVLVISRIWRKKIHRKFRAQWRKQDKVSSNLQDVLSGMRIVKSFGKEKYEIDRFCKLDSELTGVQIRNEKFFAIFYPMMTFLMGCGTYVVISYGGWDVLGGRMTIGELTQFISFAGILYGPLGWMTNLPRMIMRMMSCLERLYDILDEAPDISENENSKSVDIKGDIEFRDVEFGYRSYEPVLDNVNIHIKSGEMIGLVGASGAGKSTLINLVMRLYDTDAGGIFVDGINIRDIGINNLHSQIGVVLQETFLFSGTILDNIRFSKPEATLEEVIVAAKAANAHDFICKFSDGYNTYIGERGQTLSGGERQRISIARAIINNPKILILDEATSSLDTESEYVIQRALDRLIEGRTTIAIAHRLSTLKSANRLFVIDKNKVAESGTHNELLEKKGIYYGLVTAQLEMQQLANM